MPCERDTPISTTQGFLTSLEEMSDFQCCLGWGPSVDSEIDICTQMYTRVGLGVNLNVHHMKYALHSTLCFFSQTPFISMEIIVQTILKWLPKTLLRQGYPLYNIECQIPDALGNSAFESPHTEVCAPKILISGHKVFAIFVAKI